MQICQSIKCITKNNIHKRNLTSNEDQTAIDYSLSSQQEFTWRKAQHTQTTHFLTAQDCKTRTRKQNENEIQLNPSENMYYMTTL